jgi:ABC-type sugar transport system permease subunit
MSADASDRSRARYTGYRLWIKTAPYVFISPFFILFAIFGAFPILYSAYISFHDWKGLRPGDFIGLKNYALMLKDPQFHTALTNTLIIGLGYVPIMLILALGFAAILTRSIRLRGIYRLGYFLPVITSLVVVGLLFRFIFFSPYTPLGPILTLFGLQPKSMYGETWFIKPAIVVMTLWRWTGYNMMIMLAGLQTIPDELYDAGKIDGASGIQSFFYITVPMMSRVIAFAAILSTIGTFNLFDEVFLMVGVGGGVQQAGLVTGLLIYRTAFQTYRFGYASAIAYAVAFIILGLSLLQVFVSERTAAQ